MVDAVDGLIQAELSKTAMVAALVRAVPGVSETEIVTGPYDVIARAQVPDMNKLAEQVTSQIQAIRGVTRTTSCMIVQPSRRRPISPGRTRWIRQARWAPDGSTAKLTQGVSTDP